MRVPKIIATRRRRILTVKRDGEDAKVSRSVLPKELRHAEYNFLSRQLEQFIGTDIMSSEQKISLAMVGLFRGMLIDFTEYLTEMESGDQPLTTPQIMIELQRRFIEFVTDHTIAEVMNTEAFGHLVVPISYFQQLDAGDEYEESDDDEDDSDDEEEEEDEDEPDIHIPERSDLAEIPLTELRMVTRVYRQHIPRGARRGSALPLLRTDADRERAILWVLARNTDLLSGGAVWTRRAFRISQALERARFWST